jgi:very-short-patch-repair endonuclease
MATTTAIKLVHDARRDHLLAEMGFRVLRFWVAEVDENIEGVVEVISDALWVDSSPRPPTHPPPASRVEDKRA